MARGAAIAGSSGIPFWQREAIADIVVGTIALNPDMLIRWAAKALDLRGSPGGYTPPDPPERRYPYEPARPVPPNQRPKATTVTEHDHKVFPSQVVAIVNAIHEIEDTLRAARDELIRWGWGDMHYGPTPQERRVVDMVNRCNQALGDPPYDSDAERKRLGI